MPGFPKKHTGQIRKGIPEIIPGKTIETFPKDLVDEFPKENIVKFLKEPIE